MVTVLSGVDALGRRSAEQGGKGTAGQHGTGGILGEGQGDPFKLPASGGGLEPFMAGVVGVVQGSDGSPKERLVTLNSPAAGCECAGAGCSGCGGQTMPESQARQQWDAMMDAIEADVIKHEQDHQMDNPQAGPMSVSVDRRTGAAKGSVPIKPIPHDENNPERTKTIAQKVEAASLRPRNPSSADYGVAAMARGVASWADGAIDRKKQRENNPEGPGGGLMAKSTHRRPDEGNGGSPYRGGQNLPGTGTAKTDPNNPFQKADPVQTI